MSYTLCGFINVYEEVEDGAAATKVVNRKKSSAYEKKLK